MLCNFIMNLTLEQRTTSLSNWPVEGFHSSWQLKLLSLSCWVYSFHEGYAITKLKDGISWPQVCSSFFTPLDQMRVMRENSLCIVTKLLAKCVSVVFSCSLKLTIMVTTLKLWSRSRGHLKSKTQKWSNAAFTAAKNSSIAGSSPEVSRETSWKRRLIQFK